MVAGEDDAALQVLFASADKRNDVECTTTHNFLNQHGQGQVPISEQRGWYKFCSAYRAYDVWQICGKYIMCPPVLVERDVVYDIVAAG